VYGVRYLLHQTTYTHQQVCVAFSIEVGLPGHAIERVEIRIATSTRVHSQCHALGRRRCALLSRLPVCECHLVQQSAFFAHAQAKLALVPLES
jgi:hypothetical protein